MAEASARKSSTNAAVRAGDLSLEEQRRSFLRMVSHELRTPLNAIIGFSEIISRELCGPLGAPQYREYAEHVRRSGLKLLRLVNQVLEIARLEGRMADLELAPELVRQAIDDVVEQMRLEIDARRLRVRMLGQSPEPEALADARALRTVLANLLQNAVAYSPDAGEIRILMHSTGSLVRIVVEDDGEGVDPAEIPRLMRPFEQGQNALTRATEGAGLGLPIVALLCTAMGGSLGLSSDPGHGLRATVTLPAA